ncbi:hypothetical protein SBA7_100004 [Candidatus Sulfotelmatobacter sp. SbA7]|nr:hypothetical protein SBA7_100004 [Candidatus Sulfotelmatobacter sp. SbA7]
MQTKLTHYRVMHRVAGINHRQ